MSDVTVNIRGNASQLKNELDDVSRMSTRDENSSGHNNATTSSSERGSEPPRAPSNENLSGNRDSGNLPASPRMVEDVRRAMQQRGVLMVPGSASMTQLINQFGQSSKEEANNDISERFNAKRKDLSDRMSVEYDAIEDRHKIRTSEGLSALGDKASDPFYKTILTKKLESQRDSEYKEVGQKFDKEEEDLNNDEIAAKEKSEIELTAAIKELTDQFNRESEQGGNSHIGKLRAQQKVLIAERDGAATEEGAQDASRRLSGVNEKLRDALNGGESKQGKPYSSGSLQSTQGAMSMMSSMQHGDLGGAVMGGGSAIAGMSGMSMTTALKFMGYVAIAAGAMKMVNGAADSYENLTDLAALRAPAGGRQGSKASMTLGDWIPDAKFQGIPIENFGMKTDELGGEAARRMKARGSSENWFEETIGQIGLEKSLAIRKGGLSEGGKYDRYGTNVTDGISRMVTMLSKIGGSGVSSGDFTRVQEKYDIQQQLMGSYMGRTDKPNYDTANRTLAAFSSVNGITQDSRVGSDIQSFQNMIQNPANERMKALIYSSVQDLFPETEGRIDKIDRKLRDPENEGAIMQKVIQRITKQFGGTDTQMGYFAMKYLLPGISPDRIDAYSKGFTEDGKTKDLLSKKSPDQDLINKISAENKNLLITQSAEFTTGWTATTKELISKMNEIIGKMGGTVNWRTPPANTTNNGGRR